MSGTAITGGAAGPGTLTVPPGSTLGTMPLGTGSLGPGAVGGGAAAGGLGGLSDLFNNPLVRQLGTQLLGGALGGGAGSTSAAGTAPTAQRIEQTSIPDYAKPYVEEMLGAARANVFNVDEQGNITGFQPYPRYQADRTAQFTPLQLQAFESAQALGPSAQVPSASHIAQQAGLAGMRAADTPYSAATFTPERVSSQIFPEPGTAQQYMSPYMQNVVDIQQREAQRQADIAGQRQQAEAVRAGAFGGGRDAIMRAEAARNLALQKGDIQAQGLQSAFQQAQAQFNADQARRMQAAMANQQMGLEAQRLGEQSRQYGGTFGLQGLETALRGAGTLGQLGQTQFGQEQAALQTQAGLGQQQQQQVQALLSQQYQDFLNQQRFPYQQLGFMSDMLRGLPMSQSATSLYQAPPNPLSQIAGLGMAAYGASNLGRAAGGPVHSSPAGLADLMVSQI